VQAMLPEGFPFHQFKNNADWSLILVVSV